MIGSLILICLLAATTTPVVPTTTIGFEYFLHVDTKTLPSSVAVKGPITVVNSTGARMDHVAVFDVRFLRHSAHRQTPQSRQKPPSSNWSGYG